MQFGGFSNAAPFTVGVKSKKNVPFGVGELNQSSFFDVFSVKYLHEKYQDRLCAVPYWLKWDADKKTLQIPANALRECWLNSRKPYVFQPVEIRSRVGGSHANAIIIDVRNKRAERFEPHGSRARGIFPDFKYDSLDARLKAFFKGINVTYESATEICPYVGPQSAEDDDRTINGYCAAWSLWYVDFRMAYPDMSVKDLVNNMVAKSLEYSRTGKIREYLRRYLTQVYTFMFSEFPQYTEFFVNYDKYISMRKPPVAFDRFLDEMEKLTKSPADFLYTDYRTKRGRSALIPEGPVVIVSESVSEPAVAEAPAVATSKDSDLPEDFAEFYNHVLHVVMKN